MAWFDLAGHITLQWPRSAVPGRYLAGHITLQWPRSAVPGRYLDSPLLYKFTAIRSLHSAHTVFKVTSDNIWNWSTCLAAGKSPTTTSSSWPPWIWLTSYLITLMQQRYLVVVRRTYETGERICQPSNKPLGTSLLPPPADLASFRRLMPVSVPS